MKTATAPQKRKKKTPVAVVDNEPLTISVYFRKGVHGRFQEHAKRNRMSVSSRLVWLAEQDMNKAKTI